MVTWDANLYHCFGKERLQPSLDLASRLLGSKFERIIDIGCGSGMSTAVLAEKYPEAKITGVDLSDEMLAKAKELNLNIEWIKRDCSLPLDDLGKYDLVFSNAFVQWLVDQESFLKNVKNLLNERGIIAFQVPNWDEMPIKKCIDKVATRFEVFKDKVESNCSGMNMSRYYDILGRYYSEVEIWQTHYAHQMNSYDEIIAFISSTGLRPYLEKLDEEQKQAFTEQLKEQIKACYLIQENQKILFVFERVFFIAHK
ncbi:MAG: methyltransferase domain-containing protein [Cellulosilyticaceae bacterium]